MSNQEDRLYTIEDIEALPEGVYAELIDGKMYMMAPPSSIHQDISMWLSTTIFNYIRSRKGKCKVYAAPFGVLIRKDKYNFFLPDISVICDRDKLDQKGCHGAPDWVIEIVSPSSRRMDYIRKLPIYKEAGVREYWIVDYDRNSILVYNLPESNLPEQYPFNATIKVGVYKDLEIDFSQLLEYLEA